MMGQLIKNRLLNCSSALITSLVESLTTEFEIASEKVQTTKNVPLGAWATTRRLSHQLRNNFQNLSTIISANHVSTDEKVEPIALMEEIKDQSTLVSMAATETEFDVGFSYEEGIPDKVFGNCPKFRQIISILFTLGQKQATAERPMGCHLRFLRMDEKK